MSPLPLLLVGAAGATATTEVAGAVTIVAMIVAKALFFAVQLSAFVFTVLISSIAALLPLCLGRAKNIPKHISTIMTVFKNVDPSSKEKKFLALVLMTFSGIIPFIVFSFIPATGVPVLGLLTSTIAILLSFILVGLTFELLITPLLENESVNIKIIKSDVVKMKDDYLAVKNVIGPKWEKLTKKFEKFLNDNVHVIDDIAKKTGMTIQETCEKIEEVVSPSIKDLCIYIDKNKKIDVSEAEVKIIQERIEAWKKVAVSGLISAAGGIGAAAVARSVLVPATLWNSTLSFFGLGGGMVVNSTTFAVATTALPVVLSGALFLGSMMTFSKVEKKNLSKFLAEVIISSLPIVYADGVVSEDEIAMIHKLANNPEIMDKDREAILKALKQNVDIDYICNNFIMHEKKKDKAEIKVRLLLSIAWELAKCDGCIHPKEVEMHDRMAKIFQVEENYTQEVRQLLTPAKFSPA